MPTDPCPDCGEPTDTDTPCAWPDRDVDHQPTDEE